MVAELIQQCVKENAHVALDQTEYQARYDGLVGRFEKTKARLMKSAVISLKNRRSGRRLKCS